MTSELQEAIETAYRVFARYEARGRLEVCRCDVCVAPEDEELLSVFSLRRMPASVLAAYTHSAHYMTDQAADEFRYFLPRYFDLIAADDAPSTAGVEICLARLHDADYRYLWPAREIAAVDGFFLALVKALALQPLSIDPFGLTERDDPLEDALCMIAHARGDLAPSLAAWESVVGERNAALHLAAILGAVDWRKGRLKNRYWEGCKRPDLDAAMDQVLAWLVRRESRERLEAACLAETDEGAATLLSDAEWIVAARLAP